MKIESNIKRMADGSVHKLVFRDADPLEGLEGKFLQAVHAYCFLGGKLVLVYKEESGSWSPPGGHIEEGESIEEAGVREVLEETGLKVVHQEIIGYQDIYEGDRVIRQVRTFCIVEGEPLHGLDPDGEIDRVDLVEPQDYKKYFDWGEVGDFIMKKALELKEKYYEESSKRSS